MEIKEKIYTNRLILRHFTKNDIQAIFNIYKDEEVNIYLPWYPLKSLKEAENLFYEKYENEYKNNNPYKYAICLKEDNIPIGYIHLSSDDSYDLGYALRKELWHKQIMTEATKAFVENIKKHSIPYITATHDINNQRSGNVMKNIGMTYCYTYKEQWQPKNILVTFRMYQLFRWTKRKNIQRLLEQIFTTFCRKKYLIYMFKGDIWNI